MLRNSGIDHLQIGHEGLQVLVGHILAGIAQLVDNAVLNFGLWKDGAEGCVKSSQVVRAGDKNILYALIFQAI